MNEFPLTVIVCDVGPAGLGFLVSQLPVGEVLEISQHGHFETSIGEVQVVKMSHFEMLRGMVISRAFVVNVVLDTRQLAFLRSRFQGSKLDITHVRYDPGEVFNSWERFDG